MGKAWMMVLAGVLLLTACGSNSSDTPDTPNVAPATTAHDHSAATTDCAAGTSLTVVAQNTTFNTDCLAVPAGA